MKSAAHQSAKRRSEHGQPRSFGNYVASAIGLNCQGVSRRCRNKGKIFDPGKLVIENLTPQQLASFSERLLQAAKDIQALNESAMPGGVTLGKIIRGIGLHYQPFWEPFTLLVGMQTRSVQMLQRAGDPLRLSRGGILSCTKKSRPERNREHDINSQSS